jgi:hypothetical protein
MGFLEKLFGRKKAADNCDTSGVKFLDDEKGQKISHTIPIAVTPPRQHYVIKTEGKYMIFDSLEDMGPELRSQMENIEKIEEMKSRYTVLVEGERKVYTHFNDIPVEIREAIIKYNEKRKEG